MLKQAHGDTKLARRLLWLTGYADALLVFTSCVATASGTANLLWFLFILALCNLAVGFYAVSRGVVFEWFAEKNFKEVCKGLGFEAEVRDFKGGLWGAYKKGERKWIQPNLRCVRGNGQAFTGLITPLGGQKLEDFAKEAEAFALAFNVTHVSFERTPDGYIRMRCGDMPVPGTYESPRLATRPSFEGEARAQLQAVEMAVDVNGNAWTMPIEGQHLLIAGRTGSGKGSWIYQLIGGLEKAHMAGLVRFWGCDPKRVELALSRPLWDEYAASVEDIVALLEKAVADMFERSAQLQGKARKFTPSQQTPLNIIVIDELAYVSAMISDKKLLARAENAIKTILVLGRAVGYSLVGAAQDPRKETLGFRDFFPFRVALGLEGPMVDLVLGDKMHEAGAFCEQIPKGEAGAGCGYVISETSSKPRLVRAPWWSDEAIFAMVARWEEQAMPQVQAYQQGYPPQLDFNGQPLGQSQYRLK